MLAYQIDNNKLALKEFPTPPLNPNEILIKTDSIALNRADLYQLEGSYKHQDGNLIPGLEVAGIVIAIGSNVSAFKIGDNVCALVSGGGYAKEVIANEKLAFHIPNNLNFEQAASLPEAMFTCYMNLVMKANANPGEKLLIHAAASGIGIIAIQMAKILGLQVITTASNEEKLKACMDIGSDFAINYNDNEFIQKVISETNNEKLDIIFDCFGGEFFNHNIKLLKYGGKLLMIALLKGQYVNANLGPALMKNITIYNSTLRSQSLEYKFDLKQDIEQKFWPSVCNGKIKPIINKIFSFKEANIALNYMKAGKHIGKIIMKI